LGPAPAGFGLPAGGALGGSAFPGGNAFSTGIPHTQAQQHLMQLQQERAH
jgi:hypothetical protein